jgi:hypothetical protein
MDQVNAQNRVSQASPNLPTDVNQYGVTVNKSFGLPLLVFSVYSPNGTYDGLFLSTYIARMYKPIEPIIKILAAIFTRPASEYFQNLRDIERFQMNNLINYFCFTLVHQFYKQMKCR